MVRVGSDAACSVRLMEKRSEWVEKGVLLSGCGCLCGLRSSRRNTEGRKTREILNGGDGESVFHGGAIGKVGRKY